jgi:hypothetical protein
MTYLWFALVLLLAAGIVIVLRLFDIRVKFEATFKVLLAMLPMLVMSALYLSLLAFGAALAVLMALHAAGFDLSVIPHRHQILGLLALAAAAFCVSGVSWLRYVLLVYCEGK